jgi:hypothetical protein
MAKELTKDEIYEKISHPGGFGPGYWTLFHQLGLKADNDEDIRFFIKFVPKFINFIPCINCRTHATDFYKENKPSTLFYWKDQTGKLRGMFKYTVDFHNHANRLTGAPEMSYDKALDIWTGLEEGCKNCSLKAETIPFNFSPSKPPAQIPTPLSFLPPTFTFQTIQPQASPENQTSKVMPSKTEVIHRSNSDVFIHNGKSYVIPLPLLPGRQ